VVRRDNLLTAGIRKRQVEECRVYLHDHLADLREEIEADERSSLVTSTLGMKVWALPPWYYRHFSARHESRLAVADLLAVGLSWPRLIKVGELPGGTTTSSGTRWHVGKGILSEVIADDRDREVTVVIHEEQWIAGLENMSRRDFKRQSPAVRLGRRRRDFKMLRGAYGTAVAVSLPANQGRPALGCLTAHTSSRAAMDESTIAACGDHLLAARETIAELIIEVASYNIGKTAKVALAV
jgi:hypothetical protein